MSIHTPLGDNLDEYLKNLIAGRSAITRWKTLDTLRIYPKVGADLSTYDVAATVATLEGRLPAETFRRLRKLLSRAPSRRPNWPPSLP